MSVTIMEIGGLLLLLVQVVPLVVGFRCESCHDVDVCETVGGTLRYSVMSKGYNLVVNIPRGACYINVTEAADTHNVLALKDRSGYILNGMWRMDRPGVYSAGGARFNYRQSDGRCPGECLYATGPTLGKVTVQLLYHERNPGVHYSYQVARHLKHLADDSSVPHRGELRQATAGYQYIRNTTPAPGNGTFPEFVPIPGGGVSHRGPIFSSDFTHRRNSTEKQYAANNIKHDPSRRQNMRDRQELRDATYSRGISDDVSIHVTRSNEARDDEKEDRLVSEIHRNIWRLTDYTECTRPCGGGMQEAIYTCYDVNTRQPVTDDQCSQTIKPSPRHRACNSEPCTPQWVEGDWSICSVTCGKGQHTRLVTCQQRISATDYQQIGESYCDSVKPATTKDCYRDKCYSWTPGNWSKCSVDCGMGIRQRPISCHDDEGYVVDDTYCTETPPATEVECRMDNCSTTWYYSRWSDTCTDSCNNGVVTRLVFCASDGGHVVDDVMCNRGSKPLTEKKCNESSSCDDVHWFSGPWSQCSQTCGEGTNTRSVVCMRRSGATFHILPETICSKQQKPSTAKTCTLLECGYTWFMTDWSQCSQTCGGGVQSRSVRCVGPDNTESTRCASSNRPTDSQTCNNQLCQIRTTPTVSQGTRRCSDIYPNCGVVVEANLCRYPYYQRKCCGSCSGLSG